jgi:hypothetical protein
VKEERTEGVKEERLWKDRSNEGREVRKEGRKEGRKE